VKLSYPPYSHYKKVDVPWINRIPDHWEIKKLRNILDRVNEKNRPDLPLLSVVREKGVIKRSLSKDDENHNVIPEDLSNHKVVHEGQFAMNKMKAWQGSYGVSKFEGVVSPAYFIFNVKNIDENFFHVAIRSKAYIPFFNQASEGVRVDQWDLSIDRMKNIPFFIPPIEEQNAIVRFLDYTDRRIKRYIRAKQKLIKLLEEEKQAIIHQAVTRGLNPDVPLKQSGIEWVGDIPEHWEIFSLKFISKKNQTGSTPPTTEPIFYKNGNIPWFGPSSCTNVDYIKQPIRFLSEFAFSDGNAKMISGPALLIVIIGATIGKMGLLLGNGSTNQQITSFELKINLVSPLFVLYSLRFSEKWLASTASSATIPILDSNIVKKLPIAFPPLEEQQKIIMNIENQTYQFTNLITKIKNDLSLIQEYRTRLIADVVTGKLDVRAAAAQLPEELEDEEIDVEEVEPAEYDELEEALEP
jgi:type I restriction enzyme S subunit